MSQFNSVSNTFGGLLDLVLIEITKTSP